MRHSLDELQQQLRSLRLSETAAHLPSLIHQAESEDWTYRTFLHHLTAYEQKRREEKQIEKRLKWAAFPTNKTIEAFELDEQQSLSKKTASTTNRVYMVGPAVQFNYFGPSGRGKNSFVNGVRDRSNLSRLQGCLYIHGGTYSYVKDGGSYKKVPGKDETHPGRQSRHH